MENNEGIILFANGDILHASNIKVVQPPKEDNKEFSRSFSYSIEDAKWAAETLYGILLYNKRRAKGNRLPRKMKKALKKMYYGPYIRRTRLMNKLTAI